MKKLTFLFALVFPFFVLQSNAQAPSGFTYQSVLRDANNDLILNTSVGTQISILQGSSTGTAVYVETHTESTNANGLLTLEVGGGSVVSGTFGSIDWSAGPYFIKAETDPAGGTSYTITGTQQMMSVPYALYAANAGSGGSLPSGTSGQTLRHDGSDWVANSTLFNNGTNVGIKTTAPLASLDIKSTASGEQLLRFDTPRPWAFEQNSTGSSTQLILRSEADSKRFCIEAPDGTRAAEFNTLNAGASEVYLAPGTGNVGIGTTTPNAKLNVNGEVRITDGNLFRMETGTGLMTIKTVEADNYVQWDVGGSGHFDDAFYIGDISSSTNEVYMLGNVGVGNDTPAEKLDVTGSIRMVDGNQQEGHIPVSDSSGTMVWTDPAIMNDGDWTINGDDLINGNTGGVGIGITPIPSNNLSVKMGGTGAQSEASHVSAVNYTGAFVIGWQSFTALTNYPVESIELFYKKLNTTSSLTINIYEGQGTSGTLLFTSAPVQRPTDYDRYVVFPVGGVVNLVQGQKYTIQINNQAGWIHSGGNGYVDGASHVASRDYKFKVNVTAPYAFNVNNNGVGVNVLIPQEDLDVAGSIRMREGATAGYLPVSDANGTMVWSDPSVVDDEWIVSANGTEGAGYVLTSDSSGNATWQPNDNVDEWIVSANGTEGAGYVLTSDANGNATWKHNRSRLAFIKNAAETIYDDGGGATWRTMTNWTEWLYVENGDAVSVDANFLYSLIGGSGSNDDVAFRIVFEGQNGCQGGNGISTGRQYDWETFRNQYMPAHVSDVIEASCTGEIRFALQVYTGYTDDEQGVRSYVIKAVRY